MIDSDTKSHSPDSSRLITDPYSHNRSKVEALSLYNSSLKIIKQTKIFCSLILNILKVFKYNKNILLITARTDLTISVETKPEIAHDKFKIN